MIPNYAVYAPYALVAETTSSGISSADATAITGAFNNAGTGIMTNFVQLLPVLLGLAVIGFAITMVYKAVKKVRKGGR
ncbi:MAG: hypothetical protein K2G03_01460 [Bacilli bacterium]|nr:hypothetical protein [Bacilli bacterium]